MGLGMIGSILGFQSTRAPEYEAPDIFDIAGTKAGATNAMALINELLKAAKDPGTNKFLMDTFGREFSQFAVPMRARGASRRQRAKDELLKSGADPRMSAEIMRRIDRDLGSEESAGQRDISIRQARRFEDFPFRTLGSATPLIASQQSGALKGAGQEFSADMATAGFERDREATNAAAFRRLASAGFGGMAGMGGGGAGAVGGGADFSSFIGDMTDDEGNFGFSFTGR